MLNAQARLDNARNTLRRQVNILTDVAHSVKARFDLHGQTEPTDTRNLGGILGTRGALWKEPVVALVRTLDNGATHVQKFAMLNRQSLPLRRR